MRGGLRRDSVEIPTKQSPRNQTARLEEFLLFKGRHVSSCILGSPIFLVCKTKGSSPGTALTILSQSSLPDWFQVIIIPIAFRCPAAAGDKRVFHLPEDQSIGADRAFHHPENTIRIERFVMLSMITSPIDPQRKYLLWICLIIHSKTVFPRNMCQSGKALSLCN